MKKEKTISHSFRIVSLIACFTASAYAFPIRAEGTPVTPVVKPTIQLEINDLDAAAKIKTALIQEMTANAPATVASDSVMTTPIATIDETEIKIDQLDINKLGEQAVMVHLSVKNNKETTSLTPSSISKEITVHVADTTAPVIALKYPKIKLDYEEEWNPIDWVESVTDNSLTAMDLAALTVNNPVDSTQSGEYEVSFTAVDPSGNTSTAILAVEVREKPKPKIVGVVGGDSISSMLNLINNARAEAGLSALSLGDSNAQSAIGVRASEAAGYVSHTRPDGSHYKTAFDDAGVSYSSPLEILVYAGSSIQDKFNWWMNSSGHRSIILSPSSTKIAIGYSGKMWAAIAYK